MDKSELITTITSILGTQNISEQFIELVLGRLESLSCALNKDDGWLIGFAINKVENYIKNSCNTASIPDGLKFVAVDRICGEVLQNMKQTGRLDETFNLETAIKQVQTGDTNVVFATDASQSPEQRLNQLISHLIDSGKGEFVCYRKIRW